MARTWKSEKHNTAWHTPAWFKRRNRQLRRRKVKQALRVGLRLEDPHDLVLPRFYQEDEWLWW